MAPQLELDDEILAALEGVMRGALKFADLNALPACNMIIARVEAAKARARAKSETPDVG